MDSFEVAEILINALPYIQQYDQKMVVIKYGGSAMQNESLKKAVLSDAMLLAKVGINVVIVHGGGPHINHWLNKANVESSFVNGLRKTDSDTMEIAQMVLAGKINKDLTRMIHSLGGKAMGISGVDGGLVTAKLKDPENLGAVGEVTKVNTQVIKDLVGNGYIPVIACIGTDENGEICNINGDEMASGIAKALGADNLVLMSDIPGVLEDAADSTTLIKQIELKEVNSLYEKNIISGGMIPKVQCCTDAIKHSVRQAVILDGRMPHSLIVEFLTDKGIGTLFYKKD
ncbi:acetylglutamate kinase [Marinilactibacillus psychrotolerans]|uniref:Acetylglutamate kinase n=2 Tax=Marinilactibacillus psychrotolerans TaxID=191770 RepID=A0A511H281_9LACT|nr:acetylglutamate kinase [Marinilactibacillus psychrotolerans]TLQ06366.1 acetylglutamate kinase [Marinilactibacillus psychrotolerans]SDD12965.1 N-acetylglutamate kinase [Marinilactibacillus psychrotolerans]SJN22489.1 Acetylglutamate kinase [Marinilactibacillus psychrotolerans 42ea]GEL67637.1 acetylglutamate kinase [Marinilactibacillus psychrotolerans]GEQ33896.1 acetylglutamate kinase [Marinilactibacillus psychrotolerans]